MRIKCSLKKFVFVEKLWACKTDEWVPREKLEQAWIGEPPEKATGNKDDWSEEGEWQAKICPHWRQRIVCRRLQVLSQEGQPQTHRSIRQISREIGVPKSSVLRIVHDDLSLKCVKKRRRRVQLTQPNRVVRLQRAKKLLQMFPDDKVDFIWFTDDKVYTVSSQRNPQDDRLYVPADIKKKQVAAERLLHMRTTFSRSVMVSVGVSKLGFTDLIFVDPGVKVNGSYYRDVLFSQKLLPVMHEVSGEFFIFQQDSAPAHRAAYCQISGADNASVHFPRSVASEEPRPKPSWLQYLGHRSAACLSVTRSRCGSWSSVSWMFGTARNRVLLTAQLMSGAYDLQPVCGQEGTFWTNSVTTSVTGNVSNCVKLKYEDILLYFVCNLCQFRIVVFHKVV